MKFLLEMPGDHLAARRHAAETLLGEFLGLPLEIRVGSADRWRLCDSAANAELILPDCFFAGTRGRWLEPASLPQLPLARWYSEAELPEARHLDGGLPVLAGTPNAAGCWWLQEGRSAYLGLDLFGSAFFCLSRYEEQALEERDGHERFPASASLALRAGLLERPLLDEYLAVLCAALLRLWPGLSLPWTRGQLRFTCDIDHPYEGGSKRLSLLVRALVGDLLLRRRPQGMLARLGRVWRARRGDYTRDPNNTFDWLMQCCEAQGAQATFYIIAGHSGGAIDGCYSLDEPFLQDLLRRIHQRGHAIGLHGSYNSFRDAAVLRQERQALEAACRTAGFRAEVRAVRQHYLRWDSARTPALMEQSGFACDSTGGYADHIGFRYGTGRGFRLWDWGSGRPLALREQPLIAMEWSAIGPQYMNLGRSVAALQRLQRLKETCLRFGGDFTLLWHNSEIRSDWDRQALTALLDEDAGSPDLEQVACERYPAEAAQ
ncbi:polysaccharide deacetylase family protein [Aquibaculum arenosum]|uniref:Polysaccharide deacetylase family protein n=1 Tax=Aquibaculum arenosum TaxID=3032591 RepID=A0ABT5YLT4_9PROT|nr:polysaccharide deacetylase family protein [Fodinicurvata sp. CAU 1616]MDF2095817.1 polysaccharide deacetylase family protein [Fodinicurvata sp. CAU 1616]